VPQGNYVALFALPTGVTEEYRTFLNEMKDVGILTSFSFDEVLASRHNLMNPKHFNFQSGKWEVDWSKVEAEHAIPLEKEARRNEPAADYFDLLLIKELQIDALQHIVGIARKLKVHQKTLEYHYRVHVQKQKLIPAYVVRWMRDIERSMSHSVVVMRVTFRGLSAIDFLKTQTSGSVGVTGFCFGGGETWNILIAGLDVKAGAPFYGPQPANFLDLAKTKAAVSAVYAELDTRITATAPQMEEQLKKAGVPYQITVYPGVNHAFHNDTNGPDRYSPVQAQKAWVATIEWFRRYVT